MLPVLLLIVLLPLVGWLGYIVFRILAYGQVGKILGMVKVPTFSFIVIEKGGNLHKAFLTTPDEKTYEYFKDKYKDNKRIEVIRPGASGLRWAGWPWEITVAVQAELEELADVTDIKSHHLDLGDRKFDYEFQPPMEKSKDGKKDVEAMKNIQEEIDEARAKGTKVNASRVRLLLHVPNTKSQDLVELKVALTPYTRTLDPLLSNTHAKYPQGLIHGRIISVFRDVMGDTPYYVSEIVEEPAPAPEAAVATGVIPAPAATVANPVVVRKAKSTATLVADIQKKLNTALGLNPKRHEEELIYAQVRDEHGNTTHILGELNTSLLPEPGTPAYTILKDYGYYLIDVLVQDVEEVDKELQQKAEEIAKKQLERTAELIEADKNKKVKIIGAEATSRTRELEARGNMALRRASVVAYSKDGLAPGKDIAAEPVTSEAISASLQRESIEAIREGSSNRTIILGGGDNSLGEMAATLFGVKRAVEGGEAPKKDKKTTKDTEPEDDEKS